MEKLRTIKAFVKEIHSVDPFSAITESYVRKLIHDRKITYGKNGNRYILEYEKVRKEIVQLNTTQSLEIKITKEALSPYEYSNDKYERAKAKIHAIV